MSWTCLALHTLRTFPFYVKTQHSLTVQLTLSSETHNLQRGHVRTGRWEASDSSRRLCSDGPGIGKGRLTWQSHPYGPEWKWCLCQRWIKLVIQRDLLARFWNHTLFCCLQAALHLIQSWPLLLTSCILCESSHAYINCCYILSTCYRRWQLHEAQFQLRPWQL